MNKYNDTILYKNDLKYKKQRCIDMNELERIGHPILNEVKEDMDTIEYRLKECIASGGITLDLSNMDLEKLPSNIPSNLLQSIQNLFCSDNSLVSLDGIERFTQLKVLDCSSNTLRELNGIPNNIRELCCKNNKIESIDIISCLPRLNRLDFSYNRVECFPSNSNLRILICSKNRLNKIPDSRNIKRLICRNNKISQLGILPKLEELDCNNNQISTVENYPNLKYLYCANNKLKKLGNLINLTVLECTDNPLTVIPFFKTLEDLQCDYKDIKLSSRYNVEHASVNKLKQMRITFKN